MAWDFDGVNDYVTLADNAALTLPDGNWTIAGWVKCTSNAGTVVQYMISWGVGGIQSPFVSPSLQFFVREDSNATSPGELNSLTYDDDGTTSGDVVSTGQPFQGNTSWTHVIIQRSGTTVTQYVNNVAKGSWTDANYNAVNVAEALHFATRSNLSSTRYLYGQLAEWAKWDRALDSTERGNLSNGTLAYSPNFYGTSIAWYVPMYSGDYTEKVVGITVTNNGSVSATHPAVAYPLQMPLLSVTPTLYAPTFVGGSVTLTAPLLDVSPTLYAPTFAPTYSLTAPLLDVAPTFYAPAFAATYSLTAPLLTNTPTMYGPTFVPGSVSLVAPLLTNAPTLYAPTFVAALTMGMPLLDVSPTLYSHKFFQASQSIGLPLLTVTPSFPTHTMKRKWEDVETPASLEWRDTDFPYQKLWE